VVWGSAAGSVTVTQTRSPRLRVEKLVRKDGSAPAVF